MAGTPIDWMFEALAAGDVAAACATCTPDARIWHGFDGIAHRIDDMAAQWQSLVDMSSERFVADVRCQPTADGYVQQHLFVLRPHGGARRAWPVCVVVRVENGLIARIDEYIDRAGSFPVGDGPLVTPGL